MIAPIAAVIFAATMALSLSVEADSFFHVPTSASGEAEAEEGEAGPSEAGAPANGYASNESLGP